MNGNEATKPNAVDTQQPPPPSNDDNTSNNNNLLSHIVPPSHILDDGRFIQLPPPTTLEKSTFFERAVASRQLIANDNDNGIQRRKKKAAKSTKKKKRSSEEEVDDISSTTSSIISNTKRRKKKPKTTDTQQQYIHPLAMASAKLQSNGINELSKAINLNTLVIGNEYFGLSNIVNSQPSGMGKMIDNMDKTNKNNGDATTTNSNNIQSTIDEAIQKDQNLRTSYTLQNRHEQYKHTSTVLSRHSKRLSKSISIMQTIDNKLFTLRKQWKLCAPEHGVRTIGPVRSKEVIAVDVDVYNNNRIMSSSTTTTTATATTSQLGRIARRVPRYATIEIDDEYNMMNDIKSLRKKVKNVLVNLKKVTNDDDDDTLHPESTSSMELEPQTKLKETTISKTKAEPFAIADPTIGKIDHDFDPNKVPLLTLLFSIEKSCTGFVEFATLSSSFQSKSNDDNGKNEKESQKEQSPDERVIEALQHSLFCASLFESMRSEIIQPTSSTSSSQQQQRQQKSSSNIAWLSSEMEESFLPPPTSMAGGDSSSDSQLLCVVHCHEGEVKVQLDDEYSLTVKLIEAGTAAGCAGKALSSLEEASTTVTSSTTKQSDTNDSGSQSPTRLKTLCRALLLHSQTLYHTHCMKSRNSIEKKKKEDDKTVTLGFARTKKEVKEPSPHILQQCVSLGCKFIIEKKIRLVLKVSCMFSFYIDIV